MRCPECTMDTPPQVKRVHHCPACGDLRVIPHDEAHPLDTEVCPYCAHEPDTVAEEQLAALRRERDALRAIVRELADDLEVEVEAKWFHEGAIAHPAYQRKYERDMDVIRRARTLAPPEAE